MEKSAETAPACENYQLKWSSYNSYIHTCILTALSDDTLADVALITMDGHQIMAHRFVLAYSSQYMNKILKFQPKVTTALPIMVVLPAEISFKAMKILVKYMYSGEATVSKDILKQVLRGGDILKIKGLYRESLEEEIQNKQRKQKQAVDSAQCQSPVVITDQNGKVKEKQQVKKEPGKSNQATTTILNESQKSNDSADVPTQIKEGMPLKPGQKTLLPKPSFSNDKHQYAAKSYLKPQKVLNFSMNNKFSVDKENSSPKRMQNVILNSKVACTKDKPHTITSAEAESMENSKSGDSNAKQEKDNLSYLVIKEEPMTWGDDIDAEEDIDENVEIMSEIRVKSEASCDSSNGNGDMFSPLTCELCTETFTIPAEWVRHVQTHTDMLPAKRRRRDSPDDADENATYPELQCDLCDKSFSTPAEWVRHIQCSHTEFELSLSNRRSVSSKKIDDANKSMQRRSHTGEQPFQCVICNKGFNVKSNLLRHLRTLHNTIVNSSEVEASLEESNSN